MPAPRELRPDERLALTMARLRQDAPTAYDALVAELEVYAGSRATEFVQAPPDRVYIAQGRGQEALDMWDMFKKAPAVAEKITRK